MGCCRKDQPASFQRHLASSDFEVYVCGSILRVYTLTMIIKTMMFMMMVVVLAVTLVVIGSV